MSGIKTSPLVGFINKKRSFISVLYELLLSANKIVPFTSPKYPLVIKRAFDLRHRFGFSIREALDLGLLALNLPDSELCKFTSKREMVKIQKKINPSIFAQITDEKSIFYTYCHKMGIPVPKLYAIYFHNNAGYTTSGAFLNTKQDWEMYIADMLPSEFIIKPSRSRYGKGIACFERREDNRFIDMATMESYTSGDVYGMMHIAGENYVIQERLKSHPELQRLSNTQNLQTMRIWTFVDKNRKSHILYASLKVISGGNITDNHDNGILGNLLAEIDLSSGTLQVVVKTDPISSKIISFDSHPETGIPFKGFQIPDWDSICEFSREVSLKFLPMRLFGWDIAITSFGPYLIEGNNYADPPNHHKKMDIILSKVRSEMTR